VNYPSVHLGFSQTYALTPSGDPSNPYALTMRSGTFYEHEPRGGYTTALITQTGTVPANAQFISVVSDANFMLSLGDQWIDMRPVGLVLTSPTYWDDLRTDADSPLRRPCVAVAAPTLASDGSNPRRISDINAQESDPAWSPDGEWIAYVRRTPGAPVQNLWLMHPDGSARHALTHQTGRTFTPAWSPDSKRIVFSMNREELFALFTIGVDGKGLRSVVPTANDNFEPSWSPDGTRIAYQEDGAIFTIELGGTGVEKLTDNATNDSSPTWNPQPS